jgi:predicted transcriptional regulator
LNEAIENYIEIYQWQIAEINLAIAEADAEDFASDEISQLNFNFI